MSKLKACTDCKREISVQAKQCPHCGALPLSEIPNQLKWFIEFIFSCAIFIFFIAKCTSTLDERTPTTITTENRTANEELKDDSQEGEKIKTPISENPEKKLNVFINPAFDYHPEDPSKTRILGTTNLPNSTKMFVSIRRLESGWFDNVEIYIQNGQFYSDYLIGWLIKMNKDIAKENNFRVTNLSPGKYELKFIMSYPVVQDEEVRKIIGNNGENLSGNLVKKPLSKDNVGDLCNKYWKDSPKHSFKKERMECLKDKKSEDMRSVEFSTSIYLQGVESEEEDNRVGNEELHKLLTISSEKINAITSCNNLSNPEYYSKSEERSLAELSCGSYLIKNLEESLGEAQKCIEMGDLATLFRTVFNKEKSKSCPRIKKTIIL